MNRSLIALLVTALVTVPVASMAADKKAKTPAAAPAAAPAAKPDAGVADPKAAPPADPKADQKVDAKAAEPKKNEPKGIVQRIDKLGVKFEGPKMDLKENKSGGQWSATGEGGVSFTVGVATEFASKTFEEAKAAKSDFAPEHVSKEEKTDDGWNIQFQNKGAIGENFFVWIRRTIAGKQIQCETTVSTVEQAAKVEKICLSLQKL
jgi:hypothetical protein